MRKPLLIISSLIFVLGLGLILKVLFEKRGDKVLEKIKIGKNEFMVEVADTAGSKALGLSYREGLAEKTGMLFVFDNPEQYSFWMKGMKFSLDFIWIRDGRVVGFVENIFPDHKLNPTIYTPEEPISMALEINAGEIKKFGISVGDAVLFE